SVKQAYTRIYEPTWAAPKFEYIHGRVMEHNYRINLKKSFRFSLCGRCHNVLVKVNPVKFAVDYKLFVKTADGVSLPAKWFKESVSTVDEFLLSIHDKILLITKDNNIMPNEYSVTFKTQRETGAGTQLVDEQDFIKFKSEYTKLAARKSDIGIYVTIVRQSTQNKRKKKELDLSECEEDNERSNNYKNKNQVPNVSSLSSHDKEIAENVLKIRNAYHCNVHNRPCINKESHKDFHVEITFMMLSIWASDMVYYSNGNVYNNLYCL
ncbi:10064_t:CDS:2, partial [Racocetra fulgida]